MIFDTHAHYDSGAFNADREEVLASMPQKEQRMLLLSSFFAIVHHSLIQ